MSDNSNQHIKWIKYLADNTAQTASEQNNEFEVGQIYYYRQKSIACVYEVKDYIHKTFYDEGYYLKIPIKPLAKENFDSVYFLHYGTSLIEGSPMYKYSVLVESATQVIIPRLMLIEL